jgi:hypothetical protein
MNNPGYRRAVPLDNGQHEEVKCQVLQQDVTGLTPLVEAVREAKARGREEVWRLFTAALRALDGFGTATAAAENAVHLQFPVSLAVDRARRRVVPLDAELQVDAIHSDADTVSQAYDQWFDQEGRKGWYANGRQEALPAPTAAAPGKAGGPGSRTRRRWHRSREAGWRGTPGPRPGSPNARQRAFAAASGACEGSGQ